MALQVLDRPAVSSAPPAAPALSPAARPPRHPRTPPRRVRLAVAASVVLATAAASSFAADAAVTARTPDRMSCSNPGDRWSARYPWTWVGEVFVRFSVPDTALARPVPVRATIAWGSYRAHVTDLAYPGKLGGTMLVFSKLDGQEKPLYDTVFKSDTPVCVQFGIGPEMLYSTANRTVVLRDWVEGHDVV
jgi:hypothetical protein